MTKSSARYSSSIIIMLCLISSIGRYVLDSYLPSLPAMAHYFDVSFDNIQLTLSYYLLGFSLSQLVYGPLSDSFGRRNTLIVGLTIFTLASLACTWVKDDYFTRLLFFRFLAGVGAGSCGVLNRAIASDCFEGEKFSKAWSYTTTTLVVTLILAPLVGAYVQEFYSWKANFALSTIYVGTILLVIIKFLPETHAPENRLKWKLRQVFKSYYYILLSRSFLIPTLCYTCCFAGLVAYFQLSPLLFIVQYGLTPIEYGYSSLIIASCYLVGGIVVNRWVSQMGSRKMLQLGLLTLFLASLSLFVTAIVNPHSIMAILCSISFYVIGTRIVIANAIAEAFVEMRYQRGTASAVMGTVQMLGAALVSMSLAQFKHPSILILSIFLIALACFALIIFYLPSSIVPSEVESS